MNQGTWLRKPQAKLTAIFIHGINSDSECWRHSNGTYWPDLLKAEPELASIGIYTFAYRTGIATGNYSLSDIVDDLEVHINIDKVLPNQQIVFICHSMGGIIARRFLVSRQNDLMKKGLQDVGLFLIASPSLGSDYANMIRLIARFITHTQLDALRFSQQNVWLEDLNKDFMILKESNNFNIIGKELIEDQAIVIKWVLKKQIVEPFSAARYFPQPYKVPASDHFTIARPESSMAIQHRILVEFLQNFQKITVSSTITSNNLYDKNNSIPSQFISTTDIKSKNNIDEILNMKKISLRITIKRGYFRIILPTAYSHRNRKPKNRN